MFRLLRLMIGVPARGIFWLGFLLIVANAVNQAIRDERWLLAALEVIGAPFTFILYPFLQPPDGSAWPWPDGTGLIAVFIISLLAYPVSTVIGGMRPIGR